MYRTSDVPGEPCQWARWMMRTGGFVVWDTETTGLADDAKIVSIGIVDAAGRVLVDSLVNPGVPIPAESTAIHGVTDAMVQGAPTFAEIVPRIRRALINRRWVIYNASYDTARLRYECQRAGVLYPTPAQYMKIAEPYSACLDGVECAMEQYAIHHGDFNEYHGNYKWQKQADAAAQMGVRVTDAHNALADAMTTLELVRAMAWAEDRVHLTP